MYRHDKSEQTDKGISPLGRSFCLTLALNQWEKLG
jgi:hypothetical protein